MRRCVHVISISLLLISGAAAEDVPAADWSGFYAGVYAGYGAGESSNDWSNSVTPWTADGDIAYESFTGGVLAGYQTQLDGLVVGAEADLGLGNFVGDDDTIASRLNQIEIAAIGTLRGRVGVALDRLLLFGTAGVAAASFTKSDIGPGPVSDAADPQLAVGWAAGMGVEYALDSGWQVRAEYLHVGLGDVETTIGLSGGAYSHRANDPSVDMVRAGISYQF